MRKITWMLSGFVIVVCLSLFWSWWKEVWFIPIQMVSLADKDKLAYVDPALVKDAVAAEVKRGFFGMRINVMRDKLLEVPWLIGAQVQRKWPNTVLLKVYERQPLAKYKDKGIIDTTGKLFFPPLTAAAKQKLQDLPEFFGSDKEIQAMVEMYLLILAKIKPLGLTVKRLAIMSDHGWQAMLDNEVVIILGQHEIEERLTRFVLAYSDPKSGLKNVNVRNVDLRYTNGLAISN